MGLIRGGALALLLVLSSQAAWADDYLFACKNEWMQTIDVKVNAPSEAEARLKLKIAPEYKDYSLCSYRATLKSERRRRNAKPEGPVNPTE